MPPTDASPGSDTSTGTGPGPGPHLAGGAEDTLDLRLTEELVALLGAGEPVATGTRPPGGAGDSALLDSPAGWGAAARPPVSSNSCPYGWSAI